jgi:hypothetical protein
MTKLGVGISLNKTHVSKNTYEFAKRWIRKGVEISPLPLKGILGNVGKPLVVLQQLLDYNMRCVHNYKGSSLDLISEIYSGLKLGRRYFTSSAIRKRCFDFFHIYRYAFGNLSNEEIRSYLIEKKVPEHFVVHEKLIPLFMKELLVNGLNYQAEQAGNSADKIFVDLIACFREGKGDCEVGTLMRYHPVTHSLFHRLKSIKYRLVELRNSSNFDLLDSINDMRLEKPDRIVALKRDTAQTVATLDRL